MFVYDFEIAGLTLRVITPYELKNLFELTAFRKEYRQETVPDAVYTLRDLPEDWSVEGELVCRERQTEVYHWQGQCHRYYYWNVHSPEKYVLLTYDREDLGNYTIYLQREGREALLQQFRLSAFFAMEQLLIPHRGFQLHASVIQWQGRGILFCAPSGTGKSTQAGLWRQYAGAEILNGDRGILRPCGDGYRVYGSPYAGTSGIYRNQFSKVSAVVTLSQAPENALAFLSQLQAFQRLYRETTIPAWDEESVDAISQMLAQFVQDVPVYHLACRPDREATEILKAVLTKGTE